VSETAWTRVLVRPVHGIPAVLLVCAFLLGLSASSRTHLVRNFDIAAVSE
jgi:hypothetical protein